MSDKLLLVDAFSLIYRAFYAIRSLTGPRGEPVNAIYGFTKMLRKLLATHTPSHCAVVFDCGAPQRRLDLLPSYKQQRPPTPPNLEAQLPGIREMLGALRLTIAEMHGEEADDVIATLAMQAARTGFRILIASQDKDFCQIIGPHIALLRSEPSDAPPMNEADVVARYGVKPEQIVDYLSLIGDSADNIPGAPGIGPKTAAELLQRHGSLDALFAGDTWGKPKQRATILASIERLRANRTLISLHTNLPVPWELSALKVAPPDTARLRELSAQWGFRSLLAELDTHPAGTELLLNL